MGEHPTNFCGIEQYFTKTTYYVRNRHLRANPLNVFYYIIILTLVLQLLAVPLTFFLPFSLASLDIIIYNFQKFRAL